MTLPRRESAIVGIGATPYYFRGESLPQTLYELIGKAANAVVPVFQVD